MMEEDKRVTIDTSAPFGSVKEAVSLFGQFGYWNNNKNNLSCEREDEDEDARARQLEMDLFAKERETLEVLKELQATKLVVQQLQLELQNQESESAKLLLPVPSEGHGENKENADLVTAPDVILQQLQQAKCNIVSTTADLADIRASVELYAGKIEKERLLLEETRERLALKFSQVSSLREDLNQTARKLELAKSDDGKGAGISMGLQGLGSEAERFEEMGEAAKTEILRAISEIEQTKMRIRTVEIRLVAAEKMKEAARAAEAVALADIEALSKNGSSCETVTLSCEEYASLTRQARDAEEQAKKKVTDAMLNVDEANVSKIEILQKVEEATEEVKSCKKALEEALNRVEAANKGKLAVEEFLRQWRTEHGQKRRIVHNSTKFKHSYPSQHRRESCLLDVNGQNLAVPFTKPTQSIGQILSRKLLMPEEEFVETGSSADRSNVKQKVSLGQMLHKHQNGELISGQGVEREIGHRKFSAKRKKFGFGRFSLLMAKQSKKNKKPTLDLR